MFFRERRSRGMQTVMTAPAPARASRVQVGFEQLYRSARDDVYAYVLTLLRDRVAAEDVTATAFERAFRRAKRFDPEKGSARAWLFGIARNAALDELRRRRRHAELVSEPGSEGPDPDEEAEVALRRAVLRAALERLAPRERELVALKFFAGLSNAEIASVLGIGERAAAMRVHRTIEKLRRACDEAA